MRLSTETWVVSQLGRRQWWGACSGCCSAPQNYSVEEGGIVQGQGRKSVAQQVRNRCRVSRGRHGTLPGLLQFGRWDTHVLTGAHGAVQQHTARQRRQGAPLCARRRTTPLLLCRWQCSQPAGAVNHQAIQRFVISLLRGPPASQCSTPPPNRTCRHSTWRNGQRVSRQGQRERRQQRQKHAGQPGACARRCTLHARDAFARRLEAGHPL